jgi:D-alanyl-D-alanine dipeptidase
VIAPLVLALLAAGPAGSPGVAGKKPLPTPPKTLTAESSTSGETDPLVDATTVVPGLEVELRYATANNFLHRAVYPKGARCFLRASVAKRLAVAARWLAPKGYRLKVWDCYRPRSVQQAMWKIYPHAGYVADPKTGSDHNRGTAVDLTLLTKDGAPVEMPTDFDSFEQAAHQGDPSSSQIAQANRERLHHAMRQAGFYAINHEWWHYNAPQAKTYAILDASLTASQSSSR